ncbi:hypothetical protein DERF_009042 [Dermatophagoides farinae]|uniref:Uncharacterized protein n=1 Tax=Dermatophagoides farinae TaxID=6954 RepID=A0A922L3M0_DERFA|nr:hypothetical protein DERF_009042 [Dermatophagoides farinae]
MSDNRKIDLHINVNTSHLTLERGVIQRINAYQLRKIYVGYLSRNIDKVTFLGLINYRPIPVVNVSQQQQQQQQQQQPSSDQQLLSKEKKDVPVAGLIRIITKPDHNCSNEMILTKSVNIESNSVTFMFRNMPLYLYKQGKFRNPNRQGLFM